MFIGLWVFIELHSFVPQGPVLFELLFGQLARLERRTQVPADAKFHVPLQLEALLQWTELTERPVGAVQ